MIIWHVRNNMPWWHRLFPVRKMQDPEIGCEEVAATTINQHERAALISKTSAPLLLVLQRDPHSYQRRTSVVVCLFIHYFSKCKVSNHYTMQNSSIGFWKTTLKNMSSIRTEKDSIPIIIVSGICVDLKNWRFFEQCSVCVWGEERRGEWETVSPFRNRWWPAFRTNSFNTVCL